VKCRLKAFDRDLAAAGIAKHDDRGRVLAIHALRGTFITDLAKDGVHPRTAQLLARHSDIKLTMGAYTDPYLLDAAGAVAALPSLRSPTPEAAEIRRAAGAENTPAEVCVKLCVSGVENGHFLSPTGNNIGTAAETKNHKKTPKNGVFRGETIGGGYRGRTLIRRFWPFGQSWTRQGEHWTELFTNRTTQRGCNSRGSYCFDKSDHR